MSKAPPPLDAVTLTLPAQPAPLFACASLLVLDGARATRHPLPLCGEVTLGRGAGVDLQLSAAAGVSRRHARLLCDHGSLSLHDLDSHNGTRVNGQPLRAPQVLRSGDVLTLGEVTLIVHRDPGLAPRRAALLAAELRQRLSEEVARAQRYHCPLSLLCLLLPQAVVADDLGAVAGLLRPLDVVAVEGAGLWVLLPEVGLPEAAAVVTRALAALPRGRGGLASFPEDGQDAEALLGAAAAAAAAAAPGQHLAAAAAYRELCIAGQRILLADPAMLQIYALIEKLARSALPVLVLGETGTGKELVAQALHHLSPRREGPLCAVNCAALPESLLEGELFGYERGAFSGATTAKAGLLESAHGGTVFLDEVGELSAAAQAKLLRVLATNKVTRLGERREREVDLRVVAATHRDLGDEVSAGRFREDLLFRLNAAQVTLPPLRDRPREVALLLQRFLREACARAGSAPPRISPAALQVLQSHRWPGNVRELKNVMEYLAALLPSAAEGEQAAEVAHTIETWHLPALARRSSGGSAAARERALVVSDRQGLRPLEEEVQELERTRIKEALALTGGVQTRAAALLSVPLRTFTTKLRLYGLLEHAQQRPVKAR